MRTLQRMASGAWLIGVVFGMTLLWSYGSTAGPDWTTPADWPLSKAALEKQDRPTLVMFAHPRCPCTRASLQELEKLVARLPGQLDVQVSFYKPASEPLSWVETDLWRTARRMPGVRVDVDEDNALARQFHVATSGHVVLYDRDHRLLFSGGITAARGHAGDNFGESAILSLARGESAACSSMPVFGCPLDHFNGSANQERGGR